MHDELQPMEELDALKKKVDNSCDTCPAETRAVSKKAKKKPHGRPR
jgi:hypothetical protein